MQISKIDAMNGLRKTFLLCNNPQVYGSMYAMILDLIFIFLRGRLQEKHLNF